MSMKLNKALDLLRGLVSEVEHKTCCHEETHRGGAIWEICDSCGAKWADDEGGKPEFAWPESVEKARAFLATHHAVEQADASSCQGTNCGTTTGDHSSECLAEAAAGQGWELKPGDLCGRDCPIHEIFAEQAGGDERAACNLWIAEQQLCQGSDISLFKLERNGALVSLRDLLRDAYQAGQARAALAQPSPDAPYADGIAADLERSDWTPEDALRWYAAGKHFDTVNGRTRIIDTGAVASNALKHLSLPYLEMKGDAELTELREAMAQPSPAQAEAERPEVVARVVHSNPVVLGQCGPLNANDELMTVAQHAASVARWAEMFNRVEQQRDAALARVAELEALMQMNFGELHTARNLLSRLSVSGVNVDAILGGQLQDLVIVPADATLEMVEALKRSLTVTNRGTLLNAGHALNASIAASPFAKKAPEPVMCPRCEGEGTLGTGIDESPSTICKRCDGVGTIADAPGNLVPQAWLDVQAERRRQVEVEGYHGFRDNHYISYELSKAARAYIDVSWHALSGGLPCKKPESWPWMAGFKWSDGRTMLVKACALALAEIERLDRAAHGKEGV
ncbi:TPA: hypothetical protein N1977_003035 [Pseudomonas aeruginosa 7D9A]|nr:hypothetical protein [Pseudomonas aeruginosa]HCL2813477.1 hypothetical protein [Pseudomonas aeruginosa 7D9A]HCL3024790.1 hypothetical protein [Pseudomonas aeruginosa 7D9A]HCL3083382.1 hypothetical protein [Pseudomonas aeruginosa 7D9A]HEJ1844147.1 hypothetical protein [Pseudomonas aeruginosa]